MGGHFWRARKTFPDASDEKACNFRGRNPGCVSGAGIPAVPCASRRQAIESQTGRRGDFPAAAIRRSGMPQYVLAHDVGTSGDKAVLYSLEGSPVAEHTCHYPCRYPFPGAAEQDPGTGGGLLRQQQGAARGKRHPG